jgi:hypothetical protein
VTRDLIQDRSERPLGIRTALLAGFNTLLRLANRCRINRDYLNTRSGEQLRTVVGALKGPLVLLFVIAKDEPLSVSADLEELTSRRVPLSLKRIDSVVCAVQLESGRSLARWPE